MQESDVDDDPMDGSFAVLSSNTGRENVEHESVWDETESDAFDEESDHKSDHSEVDDDYEGKFFTPSMVIYHANCGHSNTSHGKTHQAGKSWESVIIEVSREGREDWSQ